MRNLYNEEWFNDELGILGMTELGIRNEEFWEFPNEELGMRNLGMK